MKSKQWPVFSVSEQSASVSTGTCALWHTKTITALSPLVLHSPEQQWQTAVCISSLTAVTVGVSIHYPSALVFQSMVPSSSLHMRQSPGELVAEPAVSIQTESSNHKQQPQQPLRHSAQPCQLTSTLSPCSHSYTAHSMTHSPFPWPFPATLLLCQLPTALASTHGCCSKCCPHSSFFQHS